LFLLYFFVDWWLARLLIYSCVTPPLRLGIPQPNPQPEQTMYFRLLHDETSGAMSYLLADLGRAEAVLVDPRGVDLPVLRALLDEHQLQVRWILRTHQHDDRLVGAERRARAALTGLQAPVVIGTVPSDPVLAFGDEHVEVLATPGHTDHCLSFRWRDRLFCGGLLSVDTCPFQPRPVLPAALWDSVTRRVFTLPRETLLFSGHTRHGRAASTVFEERRWHPWFGAAGRDEFLARVATLPAAYAQSPAEQPARPTQPTQPLHA
jgi:glyoxylase-like metal-dependent hydrolase (beta-lactamase superfamily II)